MAVGLVNEQSLKINEHFVSLFHVSVNHRHNFTFPNSCEYSSSNFSQRTFRDRRIDGHHQTF